MIFKAIHQNRILLGIIIWLAWMIVKLPHPLDADWGNGILLLAALVVVPLTTEVLVRNVLLVHSPILPKVMRLQLPSAMAFVLAFSLPNGWLSTLCALPWIGITFTLGWVGALQIWRGAWRDAASFSLSAGMVYLSVAGVWAVIYRIGLVPFGFSPEIIFLTIVHFHYAGFVLPVLAGLATQQLGSSIFTQTICYLTIAAVGLLAVGITLTQLGFGSDWELASAWMMALSAVAVATFHFRLALTKSKPLKVRVLWTMAAVSLLVGMLLAGLYGSRFLAPVSWLDIPMMRALHGSLNAVGFSLCAVAGWAMSSATQSRPS